MNMIKKLEPSPPTGDQVLARMLGTPPQPKIAAKKSKKGRKKWLLGPSCHVRVVSCETLRFSSIYSPFVRGSSIPCESSTRLTDRRVVRGGAWNNNPANVRSANRNRNTPANRNNNVGFRVASTLPCPS